jgi:hypothetical protein
LNKAILRGDGSSKNGSNNFTKMPGRIKESRGNITILFFRIIGVNLMNNGHKFRYGSYKRSRLDSSRKKSNNNTLSKRG